MHVGDAYHKLHSPHISDWFAAWFELKEVMYAIPTVIMNCAHAHEDLPAVWEWAQIFKDPANAKATAHYNVLNNMFVLGNDVE